MLVAPGCRCSPDTRCSRWASQPSPTPRSASLPLPVTSRERPYPPWNITSNVSAAQTSGDIDNFYYWRHHRDRDRLHSTNKTKTDWELWWEEGRKHPSFSFSLPFLSIIPKQCKGPAMKLWERESIFTGKECNSEPCVLVFINHLKLKQFIIFFDLDMDVLILIYCKMVMIVANMSNCSIIVQW